MTRERLETLSDECLKNLALQEGVGVPDNVERILLLDYLLEILEEKREERDALNNNPIRIQQKKYDLSLSDEIDVSSGTAEPLLPVCYHDTRLVLMLRDPYWAYVYWDIQGGSLKAIKKEYDAENIVLRVIRLKKKPASLRESGDEGIADSFDIPIRSGDSSWYIHIPLQGAYFRVDLVFQGKNRERVFGRSNAINVPKVVYWEELLLRDGTPLDNILSLSGVEKLDVSATPAKIPQRINSVDDENFLP